MFVIPGLTRHHFFGFGGQESNLRTPGSKPGISASRNYPRGGQLPDGRLERQACAGCGGRTRLSPAWKAGASPLTAKGREERARRKEGESNPQGSSLGRFRGGCHRQLACPSTSCSSGGGSRTPILPVNSRVRLPVPPPGSSSRNQGSRGGRIRTGGLLVPNQADCQAFPRPESSKCPAGVEPALPPWQGGRLPLHHGHTSPSPNCQRIERAPGGTRTHAAALRVRCPRRWTTSAANHPSGTRGTRTLTCPVKSRVCCR